MQTPMRLRRIYVATPGNSPPTSPPAGRRLAAACLLLHFVLVGCTRPTAPAENETEHLSPLSHDELNELIDSLANRNERPTIVAVRTSIAPLSDNPLFADDYDWDEDHRVLRVIAEFKKHNSEELWHCLLEHLDDERYVVVYAFDRLYARMQTIGSRAGRRRGII